MNEVENEYVCWRCGKTIRIPYEPNERVFCVSCKNEHRKEHKELIQKYSKLKIQVMYENALRIMEKSNAYMYEYKDSAEKILQYALENDYTFESSYEMITAIVLSEYNYEFEINKTIKQYRVDFYIPELKVCLEVDGNTHEYKAIYDNRRDIELRQFLGNEWEIIRIPTKYIDKNPSMIPQAIEEIKKAKIEYRRKNIGILPDYYSIREKEHYKECGEFIYKRIFNR